MTMRLVVIALLVVLLGCRAEKVVSPAAAEPSEVPAFEGGTIVEFGEPETSDLLPTPESHFRRMRRLDIAQLNELLLGATEGIYWSETNAPGGDNLLEELSGTLGVPDFSLSTYEDLEPSLIFQKYLGDAARSVCWQLAEREDEPGASPILFEFADRTDTWESAPEKIDANLSRLLLRFHGRSTVGNPQSLETWRWLFRSAYLVSEDSKVAWRTVCVGLISHPDFYLY